VKQIGALVAAVALVVIALVIRSQRDHEKSLGPYRLTCATEFADACRALDPAKVAVTIEPAGATADRLSNAPVDTDVGFDGWLAASPWVGMVNDARSGRGLDAVTGDLAMLGRTRVAVAIWRNRGIALRQACSGAPTWKCIGDVAGRTTWKASGGDASWGDVKIALADPVVESTGLTGLASATAGYVGSTAIVPDQLAQNDAYLKWLGALAHAVPRPTPDFAAILTQGPAVADLYIGLEAGINSVLNTSARKNDVEVVYLSPVFDVQAVLADAVFTHRKTPDTIADAVRQAGWVRSAPGTSPPLAAGPVAGLRRLWQDTVR
jgi:hypothetical protein